MKLWTILTNSAGQQTAKWNNEFQLFSKPQILCVTACVIFPFLLLLGFHPLLLYSSYTGTGERDGRDTEFPLLTAATFRLHTGWNKFNWWKLITVKKTLYLIPCSPRDQNLLHLHHSRCLQMSTTALRLWSKPNLNTAVIYAYSMSPPDCARTGTFYLNHYAAMTSPINETQPALSNCINTRNNKFYYMTRKTHPFT